MIDRVPRADGVDRPHTPGSRPASRSSTVCCTQTCASMPDDQHLADACGSQLSANCSQPPQLNVALAGIAAQPPGQLRHGRAQALRILLGGQHLDAQYSAPSSSRRMFQIIRSCAAGSAASASPARRRPAATVSAGDIKLRAAGQRSWEYHGHQHSEITLGRLSTVTRCGRFPCVRFSPSPDPRAPTGTLPDPSTPSTNLLASRAQAWDNRRSVVPACLTNLNAVSWPWRWARGDRVCLGDRATSSSPKSSKPRTPSNEREKRIMTSRTAPLFTAASAWPWEHGCPAGNCRRFPAAPAAIPLAAADPALA